MTGDFFPGEATVSRSEFIGLWDFVCGGAAVVGVASNPASTF